MNRIDYRMQHILSLVSRPSLDGALKINILQTGSVFVCKQMVVCIIVYLKYCLKAVKRRGCVKLSVCLVRQNAPVCLTVDRQITVPAVWPVFAAGHSSVTLSLKCINVKKL